MWRLQRQYVFFFFIVYKLCICWGDYYTKKKKGFARGREERCDMNLCVEKNKKQNKNDFIIWVPRPSMLAIVYIDPYEKP